MTGSCSAYHFDLMCLSLAGVWRKKREFLLDRSRRRHSSHTHFSKSGGPRRGGLATHCAAFAAFCPGPACPNKASAEGYVPTTSRLLIRQARPPAAEKKPRCLLLAEPQRRAHHLRTCSKKYPSRQPALLTRSPPASKRPDIFSTADQLNMSVEGGDIAVQAPVVSDVLPKDVTKEIGNIKLFNKWDYEVEVRDISLTYVRKEADRSAKNICSVPKSCPSNANRE